MNARTLIESHEFDYDEPGVDEATRSRLARVFPHLRFILMEHTEDDVANGGWPSIRVYGSYRGEPHDSIDLVIGYYKHGDTVPGYEPEMYDSPQLWMRGHIQQIYGGLTVPPYRVGTTDDLIDELHRLDKEYFSKAHEYSGPNRKPNIPFG